MHDLIESIQLGINLSAVIISFLVCLGASLWVFAIGAILLAVLFKLLKVRILK